MKRRDWWWLGGALVVNYTISVALLFLWSFEAFFIWSMLGMLKGYFLARVLRRKRRAEARAHWRETHPDLGEVWLPEHLREKS